jgi:beta-glucosidase
MTTFPKIFTWGAAAASYQIEGAAFEDGKGLSVWDMMCRQPGRIWEGQNGSVACDHYHRYKEDVALMKEIGLKAYRLSLSWPRVIPNGTGAINEKGLEFYDKLVDELLAAKIEPWVTLFHWDFPHALYCCGGWLNDQSPDWFADYTRVIVDRLSDRVSQWMTLNEPQCFLGLGLQQGRHAPGDRLGRYEVLLASHHTLLAHGKAVQVIRAQAKQPATIGWAPVGVCAVPQTSSPSDIEAARQAMFGITSENPSANSWDRADLWNNTWFGDPVVLGKYPDDGLELFGNAVPKHTDAEMKVISEPVDFYGANIYNGALFRAGTNGHSEKVARPDGFPITMYKWGVTPECLYWGPKFLYERYSLPIVITENGMSGHDWISEDGKCHDPQRIDFLSRYLKELGRAIQDGTDVQGYFLWSIMDNFEWAEGYKERFGIIHVDFETQVRTIKDSALWYRDVIGNNAVP